MRIFTVKVVLLFLSVCIAAGCANIVPPTGGKKDVTPPKLLAVSPQDSLLNTKVKRIEMRFNEFINVNNPATEVQVSPLLRTPLNVIAVRHSVIVNIPDSLLSDSTTYRVSFGNAIGDLHENNIFKDYTYTFSTGSYFDSLRLDGKILNAATGLPDTGAFVMLYSAAKSDSAVVREKPMYVTRAQSNGTFSFKGLPGKPFRIYALKDGNANLVYDGGQESIAFVDHVVMPVDSFIPDLALKLFTEPLADTLNADSTNSRKGADKEDRNRNSTSTGTGKEGFLYSVGVDTSDAKKRSMDITKPVHIVFNRFIDSINSQRVNLSYDSSDISVETDFTLKMDSVKENELVLDANWKEGTLYTLRLLKNFAVDSAGNGAMPSRHTFRTKSEDDYSKLNIHLPAKYNSKQYVLMVANETDTVYTKAVTDTMVHLIKLRPASYTIRIIVDKNGNGKWDTGNLFEKLQPEEVIPYSTVLQMKAGWENTVDFETAKKEPAPKGIDSPQKRDKP